MSCVRVKGMVIALVFVCLTGCIFVSGCSMGNNNKAEVSSGKVLVIDLTDKPEYQPLLTGMPQTSGMRSGRVYLKPGEECGQHSTKAHDETLVFLSGKGTAFIGEKETAFEVGQGKICYIPPHTLHNIKNTGDLPLVYIYCVAPVNPAVVGRADEHRHQH
jgi:mannose-6-phosphate isomerase-like protein (cupin superfamily)